MPKVRHTFGLGNVASQTSNSSTMNYSATAAAKAANKAINHPSMVRKNHAIKLLKEALKVIENLEEVPMEPWDYTFEPLPEVLNVSHLMTEWDFMFTEGETMSLTCPKDNIELPKAVFDEVDEWLDLLIGFENLADFETDEDGTIYFVDCDEASNTDVYISKIQALLEPFGMKFRCTFLEEEYERANALPLEEKLRRFPLC